MFFDLTMVHQKGGPWKLFSYFDQKYQDRTDLHCPEIPSARGNWKNWELSERTESVLKTMIKFALEKVNKTKSQTS